MDFLVLNWTKSHDYVHKLAQKIEKSKESFDVIVAIARGGVTVGHMLSDFLSTPLASFTMTSYKGFEKQEKPYISYELKTTLTDKKVLLVDELSDTGASFTHGKEYIESLGANVKTAAIFIREYTKFIPDYYVKEANSWVVFPWDQRETIETLSKKWKDEGDSKEVIEIRLKQLKLPTKYIKHYLTR
jgi:hypoxanthine phosphoribosyltransferase